MPPLRPRSRVIRASLHLYVPVRGFYLFYDLLGAPSCSPSLERQSNKRLAMTAVRQVLRYVELRDQLGLPKETPSPDRVVADDGEWVAIRYSNGRLIGYEFRPDNKS